MRSDGVDIAVWAPTAQSVRLRRFDCPTGGEPVEVLAMQEAAGVWSLRGPASWVGSYYQYEVVVHSPWTLRTEHSVASDPYSRCLSANGERSLIIDLADAAHQPHGWASLASHKPPLDAFVDMAIYELHVRDFSATVCARWVTLRARWVTRRARWVTLRARWVTRRARWVTLSRALGRKPSPHSEGSLPHTRREAEV